MTDRVQNDSTRRDAQSGAVDADVRLGGHAIALLQAARDAGDPALIAQAEAIAMAVGFALAARLPDTAMDEG